MHFSAVRGVASSHSAPVAELHVGIGELKITGQPNRLITLGLGSCIGITLYDPVTRVGGLLHIMLPDSKLFNSVSKPEKYADLGIPLLVSGIRRNGGKTDRIQAKIAGGAQMFKGMNEKFVLNIGERNISMSKQVLKDLGIRIMAEEVGGSHGRTMILDTLNGQVLIRTVGSKMKVM